MRIGIAKDPKLRMVAVAMEFTELELAYYPKIAQAIETILAIERRHNAPDIQKRD